MTINRSLRRLVVALAIGTAHAALAQDAPADASAAPAADAAAPPAAEAPAAADAAAPAADAAAAPTAEPAAAAAPAAPAAVTAPAKVLDGRWYVAPMGSFTITDGGRRTKDGYGGAFAIGHAFSEEFAIELSGQYSKLKPATLYGVLANVLFFPTKKSLYAVVGAGYGHANKHPGADPNYATVLFNTGLGYLWGAYKIGGLDLMIRTEALYRLDAHSTTRTGSSLGNGRRSFNEGQFNVGVLIPFGEGRPAPAAAAEPPPVEPQVVPVAEAPPAPAEAAPAPAPPPCRTPVAGEKVDLSGCGNGDVIVLRGVNFDFNKATLTANARTILDQVVEALNAAPAIKVEIGGHTDGKGSDSYNLKLSQKRADAVKAYLVAHGIAAERMSTKGYGKSQPIADNGTDEGREQNRRVELKVVGSASASAPAPEAAPAEAAPAN